jgi:hypothetical protein
MWFASCAYVNAENVGWMPDFLAKMAIMQPINAQLQAHMATEFFAGGVADASRPENLADAGLAEVLEVAAQVYAPIGREDSRWIGESEFSESAENYAQNDNCFGFGDEKGLSAETPFGSATALVRLMTDQKHPQLGSGLLATLQLPFFGEDSEIANECAGLNFLEAISWTGFPLFGCWHPNACPSASGEEKQSPAFITFVPNALYQPGLTTNVAFWMLERARWVRQTRWPDLEDKRMIEIREERYRSPREAVSDPLDDGFAAYQRGDYEAALQLWQPLAEQGNAQAQHNLGVLYDKGEGVTQDYAEAMKWYHLAAEQGDYIAQYKLGVMCREGKGVPQDYPEAAKWYRLASEHGHANAQQSLCAALRAAPPIKFGAVSVA